MKLSLRVGCVIFGLMTWGSGLGAGRVDAQAARSSPSATPPSAVTEEWEEALTRRIERTLPVLLNSLYAARRERDPALVRCFDRAVAGLNGVQRQVIYHAELHYEASSAGERARHAKALLRLSERVDELAHSLETCFTDGVPVKSGETVVEVVKQTVVEVVKR